MAENSLIICKTCLITNVKMFQLDTLNNAYSELTGLQCDNTTTEYVCYQCAALLLKFQQFRTKCLRANQMISKFVRKYSKLTEDVVNMIDRKLYKLESTIIKIEIKENIFNEFYNESNNKIENKKPEQSIKMEIDNVIAASEIKYEVELYDDKDQVASDEYESLHLEDDIDLDREAIIVLVTSDTEDESTKMNVKNEPLNKKLEQGKIVNSINTKTINGYKNYMDEYLTIVTLTPEEAKNEVLLRKESDNYKKNKYKCDLCYRGFGVLQTYENHMKKHNKEIGDHDCQYCHFRHSTQWALRKHMINCHAIKFCCKSCPYTCASPTQAKSHVGQHKGNIYPCEECGQIFSLPNSLVMHKHTKHSTEFVCGMCGNTFGKERGLKLHISYIHKMDTNEKKGPVCEECDVHFATETAWKRHLVLSSKHTVSYGCEVCGETHESKEALRRHFKVHPRNKGWEKVKKPLITQKKHIDCTLCEQSLFGRKMYMEHIKKHHPEDSDVVEKPLPTLKYICEVCGKMFKHQILVTHHKNTVHTVERPFSCSVCGKTYKQPNDLKIHSLTHTSTRFQCHLCEKSFPYLTSLDRHIKRHLGIRPYKCNICEKSFAHPCEVKYHNRYVHENVPWPKRDRSKRIKSASEK